MSSVSSQPHFVFGPRSGGLELLDENTVLFTCGSRCVMQHCAQRWQRFLPGSDRSVGFCSMALSPNRRYLAASEKADKASIIVFDLQHQQGKKRKVLTSGDLLVQEFLSMAFSPDSKYLIAQSGAPEWMLMIWFVEENKVLATVKTTISNNPVTQISFNPHNNLQICVSGNGVFKMFRHSGGVLRQSSIAKVESVNLLCHTWLSEDRVVAGTDSGRLLVSESGELRREMKVSSKAGLGQNDRYLEVRRIKEGDATEGVAPCGITALLSCSRGFLCSTGPGTVCLFEKMEEDIYRKIREIQILPDPACSDASPAQSQQIDTMCISPAEETLAVGTDRGQLYSFNLSSANIKQEGLLHFDFLSSPFHSNTITGLSICIRKPLVATSSLDRSVRIWNYETKDLEVSKEFQEEAFSVALHPTGLFILVGFSNKLRLMNVFIDDIRTFKEFSLNGCRECAFSHGGHMFAAVNGNVIHIYSFTSFENTLNLKGHMGKVWRIEWSLDDSRLASCGTDGAVYEWNTQTGRQESESVLKSCSYTDLAFSSDYKTILAVGTDRTLREIQDCQVLREVPPDDIAHTALAVSHSGRVVFTGTSSGTIRAIKYPLPAQKEWMTQQAHSGRVTRMVITYDDQFLLSVSEDGCLLISKITDKEGRGLRSNSQIVHTEEIVVTKADLKEKAKKMLELKLHLEELYMENEYRLRLKEVNFNEKLKELTEQFTKETQSLKTAQQILNSELEKQKCETQQSSTEAAVKHSRDLKDLERSYTTKLVLQHKEYEDLLQKHEQMKEDYNRQLKHAEENKAQALVELTEKYEARLHNQTRLLAQRQEEAEQKIQEFKEILKQAEKEEQKNIHTIQSKYEKQLLLEKEAKARLKEDGGVMTQKIYSLQMQIDHDSEEMSKIKKERQSLIGFIRSLEGNVLVLKRQISEQEKTIQDKLEEEVAGITKSNTQLKLTTSDLRLKLKTKDKEVQKELQKVKNLQTLLERLRSDLHGCVSLVQEPKELKDNILMIYGRYAPDTR
ncbi:PREDICTED: cilia- and flagella-associated protein 57 [Cyprinodon variegatus]|uniref:cilia- and flagella-associated protein 57 n=1 Tax=Cyprinodon variegatus TaxID=28743 RepID=UPI0007428D30|nr:PREDICTED: cilia- and flagella-associated protein 57 [Cyprinodon variegatus]